MILFRFLYLPEITTLNRIIAIFNHNHFRYNTLVMMCSRHQNIAVFPGLLSDLFSYIRHQINSVTLVHCLPNVSAQTDKILRTYSSIFSNLPYWIFCLPSGNPLNFSSFHNCSIISLICAKLRVNYKSAGRRE